MTGLPSACFCCGVTADALRRRATPVRVHLLAEEAAAGLVLQQAPAALALARAASHALDVICHVCRSLNWRLEGGHAACSPGGRELASLSRSPSPIAKMAELEQAAKRQRR